MPGRPWLGRWARLALLTAFSAAVAVLAAELTVRWIVRPSDQFFTWDPRVGIAHVRGMTGRSVGREFDVAVRINTHGFRDREREVEKPPGTWRVAVLGDSMTEALQVTLDETFVALLEQGLRGTGRPVEVLNFGLSALGTAQEYLVFRHDAVRYSPDVVLLVFFTGNDFRNNSRALDGQPQLPYPVVSGGRLVRDEDGEIRFAPGSAPSPTRAFLRRHVKSVNFLTTRFRELDPFGRFFSRPARAGAIEEATWGLYERTPGPAWQEAIDVTLAMMGELHDEVRRRGAAFFVAIMPGAWEISPAWRAGRTPMTGDRWDVARPERVLTEFLRQRRIPALAVGERFRREAARGNELFMLIDGHLTPLGHRVMAEELATALTAQALVPGR